MIGETQKRTYVGFLILFLYLCHPPNNTVLFNAIALIQRMPMKFRCSIGLSVSHISIDALDRVVFTNCGGRGWEGISWCHRWQRPCLLTREPTVRGNRSKRGPIETIASSLLVVLIYCSRQILCNFNLDVAKIPLTRCSFALLLVRITGFRRPRRPTFQPTIPVM